MKRSILYLIVLTAVFTACHKEEVTEKTFEVTMTLVQSTQVRFEVYPENNDFYYNYICVPVSHYDSVGDVGVVEEFRKEYNEWYAFLDSLYAEIGKTFDHSLMHYDGSINGYDWYLCPETNYYLCLIRLKKKNLEPLETIHKTPFRTVKYQEPDISFKASAEGDVVTITPSLDTATYYYDIVTPAEVEQRYYGLVPYFLYENIANFEIYGYMQTMLSKGVQTFRPTDYYDLMPNDTVYLAAVGYQIETNPNDYYFRLVYNGTTYSLAPYDPYAFAPARRSKQLFVYPSKDAILPGLKGK